MSRAAPSTAPNRDAAIRTSLGRVAAGLLALSGAVALAGCDTVGSLGQPGRGVAEVQAPTQDTSVNIASLTDVVRRNPNDSEAYNTRGAPPMPASAISTTPSPTSPRR